MSLTVGVCITTHNRRAELERTLRVLSTLQPPPDEILVAADGCTDGTVEFVHGAHPGVTLIVNEKSRGSIPSRNALAAACASDVFLSLDDDSYPVESDFIAKLRQLFIARPRLAVASFPQRTDEFPQTLTATDFGPPHFIGSYANSSAAVRRAVFHELGGYPDFFFHAYEEPDFALRCVAAGWEVRQETALTIRHHFTPLERNEMRNHHRHARNEFWSVLLRCPAPQLFAVALFRAVRQFGYASTRGWDWAVKEPSWWVGALGGVRRCLAQREPLAWSRYRTWMALVRKPIYDEAEWLAKLGKSAT